MSTLHPQTRAWRTGLAATVVLALAATACGDDTDVTASAPAAAVTPIATTPSTTPPATAPETVAPTTAPEPHDDVALVASALLAPEDLDGDWRQLGPGMEMSHEAELAAGIASCADYSDLVFENGAQQNAADVRALGRGQDLIFTYVVAFDTPELAAEMVAAVGSEDFNQCWADFNEAAMDLLPIDVSEANYEPAEPPSVELDADSVAVKYLQGTLVIGGLKITDSCLCIFAQVDRMVVAVHSADYTLPIDQREVVLQTAIDKARAALGA